MLSEEKIINPIIFFGIRYPLSHPLGHRNEATAEHLASNLQNIEIKQGFSTNKTLDNSQIS